MARAVRPPGEPPSQHGRRRTALAAAAMAGLGAPGAGEEEENRDNRKRDVAAAAVAHGLLAGSRNFAEWQAFGSSSEPLARVAAAASGSGLGGGAAPTLPACAPPTARATRARQPSIVRTKCNIGPIIDFDLQVDEVAGDANEPDAPPAPAHDQDASMQMSTSNSLDSASTIAPGVVARRRTNDPHVPSDGGSGWIGGGAFRRRLPWRNGGAGGERGAARDGLAAVGAAALTAPRPRPGRQRWKQLGPIEALPSSSREVEAAAHEVHEDGESEDEEQRSPSVHAPTNFPVPALDCPPSTPNRWLLAPLLPTERGPTPRTEPAEVAAGGPRAAPGAGGRGLADDDFDTAGPVIPEPGDGRPFVGDDAPLGPQRRRASQPGSFITPYVAAAGETRLLFGDDAPVAPSRRRASKPGSFIVPHEAAAGDTRHLCDDAPLGPSRRRASQTGSFIMPQGVAAGQRQSAERKSAERKSAGLEGHRGQQSRKASVVLDAYAQESQHNAKLVPTPPVAGGTVAEAGGVKSRTVSLDSISAGDMMEHAVSMRSRGQAAPEAGHRSGSKPTSTAAFAAELRLVSQRLRAKSKETKGEPTKAPAPAPPPGAPRRPGFWRRILHAGDDPEPSKPPLRSGGAAKDWADDQATEGAVNLAAAVARRMCRMSTASQTPRSEYGAGDAPAALAQLVEPPTQPPGPALGPAHRRSLAAAAAAAALAEDGRCAPLREAAPQTARVRMPRLRDGTAGDGDAAGAELLLDSAVAGAYSNMESETPDDSRAGLSRRSCHSPRLAYRRGSRGQEAIAASSAVARAHSPKRNKFGIVLGRGLSDLLGDSETLEGAVDEQAYGPTGRVGLLQLRRTRGKAADPADSSIEANSARSGVELHEEFRCQGWQMPGSNAPWGGTPI